MNGLKGYGLRAYPLETFDFSISPGIFGTASSTLEVPPAATSALSMLGSSLNRVGGVSVRR